MKSFIKLVAVSILSSLLAVFIYDRERRKLFSSKKNTEKNFTKSNLFHNTSLVNYNNTNNEETDFMIAAASSINGVVHIKNTSNYKDSRNWLYNFYGDSAPKRIGNGSGVIVSADGFIITNDHVIKDASEIEVTTNDNKVYIASLIGSDPYTDIAVLKIDAVKKLDYITFGNSETTKIGEWVLAVGNPFNLNSTVTAGIVSAKSRDLNKLDQKNQSFIQTDAAVNQGNSGGALINLKGELIGINTAITSIAGGFVGYSFAVPSNLARKVFEDILEYGNVQKGLLGVTGNALDQNLAKKLEINETEGFYINDVEPNLGAEKAGLQKHDIIIEVDNIKINKFSDMSGYLSTKRPGDEVKVKYFRKGKKYSVMVVLKKINRTIFLGMELRNITNSDKKITKDNPAVKITDIQNSRLYRLGIEKGYFILKVNDINVNDINEVDRIDIEALNSILFMSPSGEKERIIFE
ncbi:MAG: serine protease [Flavobacteriaceae bacterium]|nr:serine protease [Flavobacteriaceae bacterium]|tara:strand:- start:11790 stop:13181 length:1392 start_codon:yes stop_codon:yes gene_type:complete